MPVRLEDLQLVWPRELFIKELRGALVATASDPWSTSPDPFEVEFGRALIDLLFHEAFHDTSGTEWLEQARLEGTETALLGAILAKPARVPTYVPPRLYRDRKAGAAPRREPSLTRTKFAAAIEDLFEELDGAGYFDSAFGSSCVDDHVDHRGRGERKLSELMGSAEPWPPQLLFRPDDDHLYTVVEAAHYFVARPRSRTWHSYGDEWDYADFDRSTGQEVYRWRVNTLMERYGTTLRLDHTGFVVETTSDPRDELLQELTDEPPAANVDALRHATELFRRRGATREEKRSAVVALAGILEEHRKLLDQELLSKDEGALFEIANKFAIRHQRANQRSDYDAAYLDWLFWWYLATVALVKQLLKRGKPDAQ